MGPILPPGLALPPCEMGLPAPRLVHLDLLWQLVQFYLLILLVAMHIVLGVAAVHHGHQSDRGRDEVESEPRPQ
jgi:hypothetical protein